MYAYDDIFFWLTFSSYLVASDLEIGMHSLFLVDDLY